MAHPVQNVYHQLSNDSTPQQPIPPQAQPMQVVVSQPILYQPVTIGTIPQQPIPPQMQPQGQQVQVVAPSRIIIQVPDEGNDTCRTVLIVLCFLIILGTAVSLGFILCLCIAADNTVWVRHDDTNEVIHTTVSDIKIGDYVLTYDPFTKDIYWDEVLLQLHYSWFDGADSYYPMRTLYLDDNISSITLSNDHLIYLYDNNIVPMEEVTIGDMLYK